MDALYTVLGEVFSADRLNYVLLIGWLSIILMDGCVKLNTC